MLFYLARCRQWPKSLYIFDQHIFINLPFCELCGDKNDSSNFTQFRANIDLLFKEVSAAMEFTVDIFEVIILISFFEVKKMSILSTYVWYRLFPISSLIRSGRCVLVAGRQRTYAQNAQNLALATVNRFSSLILTKWSCGDTIFLQFFTN